MNDKLKISVTANQSIKDGKISPLTFDINVNSGYLFSVKKEEVEALIEKLKEALKVKVYEQDSHLS